MIRSQDFEQSKSSLGDEKWEQLKFAQNCKSGVNFALFLMAFWRVRTSTVFYIAQYFMLIYFQDLEVVITTMNMMSSFIILILVWCIIRWSHSIAVTKLNQIHAGNFKFKKVLDCSQDAICIFNQL